MAEKKSIFDATLKPAMSKEDGFGLPKVHRTLASTLAYIMSGEAKDPLRSIISSTSAVEEELDELNEAIALGRKLPPEKVKKLGRLLGEELVDIYILIESVSGIKDPAAEAFMAAVIRRKGNMHE